MVEVPRGGVAGHTGLFDFKIGEEDDIQGYYLARCTRKFIHAATLLRGFRARRW